MARWARNGDADLNGLALMPEEGFLLSRLDTPQTRDELVEATGLPAERVDYILALLEGKGIALCDTPSIRPPMETEQDLDAEPDAALHDDDEFPTLQRVSPSYTPQAFHPMTVPQAQTQLPSVKAVPVPPPPRAPSTNNAVRDMLMTETLADLLTLASGEDVPDETRAIAAQILVQKYEMCAPEDRASFVIESEGRVLEHGIKLDARTASVLGTRTYTSVVLIRRLARIPTLPAPLLAHLVKQAPVKRDTQLRQALLRNPNMPGDAKRRG